MLRVHFSKNSGTTATQKVAHHNAHLCASQVRIYQSQLICKFKFRNFLHIFALYSNQCTTCTILVLYKYLDNGRTIKVLVCLKI